MKANKILWHSDAAFNTPHDITARLVLEVEHHLREAQHLRWRESRPHVADRVARPRRLQGWRSGDTADRRYAAPLASRGAP